MNLRELAKALTEKLRDDAQFLRDVQAVGGPLNAKDRWWSNFDNTEEFCQQHKLEFEALASMLSEDYAIRSDVHLMKQYRCQHSPVNWDAECPTPPKPKAAPKPKAKPKVKRKASPKKK